MKALFKVRLCTLIFSSDHSNNCSVRLLHGWNLGLVGHSRLPNGLEKTKADRRGTGGERIHIKSEAAAEGAPRQTRIRPAATWWKEMGIFFVQTMKWHWLSVRRIWRRGTMQGEEEAGKAPSSDTRMAKGSPTAVPSSSVSHGKSNGIDNMLHSIWTSVANIVWSSFVLFCITAETFITPPPSWDCAGLNRGAFGYVDGRRRRKGK